MAINSVVELGPHDPELRAELEAHFSAIRALLITRIEAAQAWGEVRQDQEATTLADLVITTLSGIAATSRGANTDVSPVIALVVQTLTGHSPDRCRPA